MIPQRYLGGISLPILTYGTMRMTPQRLSVEAYSDILREGIYKGWTSFHVSNEYDSHPFFLEVLSQLGFPKLQYIAKVAVPHFEDESVDFSKLEPHIDQYLKALKTDRIEVIQWLLRSKPISDASRLATLSEYTYEINLIFTKLKQKGKIGTMVSFPYSQPFAEAVLDLSCCNGLADYLNPNETERVSLFPSMADQGQGYIAIRPFGGGELTAQYDTETLLNYVLNFPLVCSTVVSVNSLPHFEALTAFALR